MDELITYSMMKGLYILCIIICAQLASGYKSFQDDIPNGGRVPHPCKPNQLWQGVGHLVPGGGGKRNPFGVDFYRNGKKWDKCLCEADSDGDGKTNGEELGDPHCKWPEVVPEKNAVLSHPGICEPIDSERCRIKNVQFGDVCEGAHVKDPCIQPIKDKADTREWKFNFPSTPVPAEETVYMCQVFEFPDVTSDFHAVAYEPFLDNEHVMHHILVYGCTDNTEVEDHPSQCGMGSPKCTELLFIWQVGVNGRCLNEEFGFRVGKTGVKKVQLQIHWNNPQLKQDYTDGSGLIVYYTPNLRDNDGGVIMTGETFIDIPPSRRDVEVIGYCPAQCSSSIPGNIYIADAIIHMHYLGYKGYIYHTRNNNTLNNLVIQDEFSYDSPQFFNYRPALEFKPGDEIKTVCHFKSTSRSEYTYYGDGTSDEMCYGFLTYYPRTPMVRNCHTMLGEVRCGSRSWDDDDDEEEMVQGCNMTKFGLEVEGIFNEMAKFCDYTGKTCMETCPPHLAQLGSEDPCYTGDFLKVLKQWLRRDTSKPNNAVALAMLDSCQEKSDDENRTKPDDDDKDVTSGKLCEGAPGDATTIQYTTVLLAAGLLIAYL